MMPGRGAHPDNRLHPAVRAQLPFASLAIKVGASTSPRGKASLAAYRCPRLNQNGFGACTTQAATLATVERMAVLGKPLPWIPSQLALWSDGLIIEGGPGLTANQLHALNVGMQSVTLTIAMGHGIRPMGPLASDGRFSDIDTGPVAPGLDQLTTAAMCPKVGAYRIDNTDPTWPTQAAIALDNGIPVYVAMYVGADYDAWTPNLPPIDKAESGVTAGHAMLLDEYVTTSSGLVFSAVGSYGTSYADDGVWLFDENGLRARTFDGYRWETS